MGDMPDKGDLKAQRLRHGSEVTGSAFEYNRAMPVPTLSPAAVEYDTLFMLIILGTLVFIGIPLALSMMRSRWREKRKGREGE